MNENIVHYIKIKALTPVHVGAGPEKKWIKDLDFFYDNGKIKVFDLSDVLKNKNGDFIVKVANAISGRKLFSSNLIQKKTIKPFFEFQHDGQPEEIFVQSRTGMGDIIIPGSSLKGAITSAILGYLYKYDQETHSIGRDEKIDEKIFGSIQNSVMRLIQFTDAQFAKNYTGLFNTKIYSMGYRLNGEWKHDLRNRNGDRSKFNENDFVNTYECIKTQSESYFRIVIVKNIIDQIGKITEKKPQNIDKILKTNTSSPAIELFKMINQQTINYVKKEIEYFKQHEGDKSEQIIETLENLYSVASDCSESECVLHLGSGSGFHGVTGDWQFESHIITSLGDNGRGQINATNAAKTRRLVFQKNAEGEYEFYPMGFVKLSVTDEKNYHQFIHTLHTNRITPQNKTSTNNQIEQKETQKLPTNQPVDESTQQIVPYAGKIKQGIGRIPAEVIESGKPNKVKIYIKDYTKNDIFILSGYSNTLEIGKKIFVRINQINSKNEILNIGFEGFM